MDEQSDEQSRMRREAESPVQDSMTRPDPRSLPLLLGGIAILALASLLMLLGVEPVYTWYYGFAWYSTIAIADAWGHRRFPARPMLLTRPAVIVSLILWSTVIWLFFELWNLRLANWYYVWVPQSVVVRRLGIVLAFGTVLPGIFAIEKLLAAYGVGNRLRTRGMPVPRWLPGVLVATGLLWAVLVLAWPRSFFPLVWGVTVLIMAPLNRRLSGRGVLADLEAGNWTRIVRLLLAGLVCGLLWEMFNIRAGSKWIYTVPGFEEFKLFEMPLLGFFGFPPFALECLVMYRTLVLTGVAVPWEPEPARRRARAVAVALAGGVAAVILVVTPPLMDRFTVDSWVPRMMELLELGVPPPSPTIVELRRDRLPALEVRTPEELARLLSTPAGAAPLGIEGAERAGLQAMVELALLKGIGADNARRLGRSGIDGIESLAQADSDRLAARLAAAEPGGRVIPSRVRVWVGAARRAVERESPSD